MNFVDDKNEKKKKIQNSNWNQSPILSSLSLFHFFVLLCDCEIEWRYERAWGWSDKNKKNEMRDPGALYLVAFQNISSSSGNSSFLFDNFFLTRQYQNSLKFEWRNSPWNQLNNQHIFNRYKFQLQYKHKFQYHS
jgi:hypothetical protein